MYFLYEGKVSKKEKKGRIEAQFDHEFERGFIDWIFEFYTR